MLQKGNTKLGKEIYAFSLPAHFTCPGETTACASVCYAKKGYYHMSNVKDSHRKNWRASKKADFAAKVIAAIGRRDVNVFRIHPSGDFYSAEYVRKWIEIAKAHPGIKFYAYTRSWRRVDILEALIELAALDNVYLWWSADKATHELDEIPPVVDRVRVAYMQMTDDEPIPPYTDLIFRVKRDTLIKAIDRKPVCPVETGVKYAKEKKPTCSSCKMCYRDRAVRPNLVQLAPVTSAEPCLATVGA